MKTINLRISTNYQSTLSLRKDTPPAEIFGKGVFPKRFNCIKIKSDNDLPNGPGHSSTQMLQCFSEISISGLIKNEIEQTLNMPGSKKIQILQSEELIEWGHGK